jgi:iron complex outermembrane recepter protein
MASTRIYFFKLTTIATAVASAISVSITVNAQTAASPASAPAPQKIEGVVVIGNPLDARDVVAPVSTLSGTELLLKKGSTIGETLNNLPGVSQSWFGPNASRPVIRGLDGDRIRILNNLGSSLDASSLSNDHNPSIDPLVVEKVEVLRGPAALLYGGAAIGGVVNIVDNRIPRNAISGVSGSVETRFGGAERERGTSAVAEFGGGGFQLHLDAFTRDTDDYKVPASTGVGLENGNRVVNSASDSKGGAVGASYQLDKGYVGASHSEYRSNYGTVAEPGVRIRMEQKRDSVEANFRDLTGFVNGVFAKFNQSDYKHTEFDEGEPQTTFKNKGNDFRLEVKHAKLGPLQGVIGLQAERFDFSALGAEAFVPQTRTQSEALFAFEEIESGPMKFQFGARVEKNKIRSDGEAGSSAARFGESRTRAFTAGSGSVGGIYKFSPEFSLTSNLAFTQRAPTFYELYADGPHGATGAYEAGNPSFKKERSTAIDLALQFKNGASSARVGVFAQKFSDYISLRRTGIDRDSDGNGAGVGVTACEDGTSVESECTAEILPEFRYTAVDARFVGFEIEGKQRVIDGRYTVDVEAKVDYTRAQDQTNGEPIPRVAPLRVTGGVIWAMNNWGARVEVQNVAKQNRFSRDDLGGETAGYTFINAAASYGFKLNQVRGTVFLRGTNLSNKKAFNASSIDTIRGLAPLPGRGVKVGIQVNF